MTSSETIDGEIEVVLPFANTSVTRRVQVAGSTTKQVFVVVPTTFDQRDVSVRFTVGGDVVAEERLTLTTSSSVEIVGIMPALATRLGDVPEQVQLASDLGRAQLQEIPDEYFTLGPAALEAYDTIVGVGGDLAALDAGGRGNLLAWLNHGGRLLLDDDAGLDVLPEAWRPGPAGYAWAGRGEVRFVDGAATAGRFGDIIEPSSSSPTEQPGGFFGATEGGSSIQEDLARRAGVKLPSLTPILVGMVIYVLVVGPLLYVGLRMWRRLALGWALVPLLAVVSAGAILVVARDFRDGGRPAAVAFSDGFPGGSEDQVAMLTFTRSGGTSRIAFPTGWQVTASLNGFQNFDIAHLFASTPESGTFEARLEPGQVTDAAFVGLGGDVGLSVTARTVDATIVGTVTNSTPGTLADVAVFSAGDSQLIGTLAPGESKDYEMTARPLPQVFGLAQSVWSRPDQGLGFGTASDKAEFAIWSLASERLALYPTGLVRAAGWTDDLGTSSNAGTSVATRTVLTSTAPVLPGDGPLSEGAVRTVQVRSPFDQFGGGTGDAALRYLLPPGIADQPLEVSAAVGMKSLEFWDGEEWMDVPIDQRTAAVPPEAVRDGVVLMRIQSDVNFTFDPGQILFLHGVDPEDET